MSQSMQRQGNPLDLILSRLDGVQSSGVGYRARCPACGGKSRKLSVTSGDDGRVLLHCFGGCEAIAVVQAVGLSLPELFPERMRDDTPESRRQAQRHAREAGWGAAMAILDFEAAIVVIAAGDLAAGVPLNEEDRARLALALERISDARQVLRPITPRDVFRQIQRRNARGPTA